MSLIEFKGITKCYQQHHHTVQALRGIDLAISKGSLTAIMGVSGSGKSTLMNIMGLLDTPTSGDYLFNGEPITDFSEQARSKFRNQHIGFVFQSFFLLPRLSALENVMLPLHYSQTPRELAVEHAKASLDQVGVAAYAHHFPNQLSGGQQQRVAIARALVTQPAIVLADEPTGSLDSQTGQEVMHLFSTLHAEGRTMVIITHDKAISQHCQQVTTIKDGLIQA